MRSVIFLSLVLVSSACTTQENYDNQTSNLTYFNPNSSETRSSERLIIIDTCRLASNSNALLKVKVLSDLESHPSTCDEIPYSMSHFSLKVKVEDVLASDDSVDESLAGNELEIIFVDIKFMVNPMLKDDILLINARKSGGTMFAQTHVLLIDEEKPLSKIERNGFGEYDIDLPDVENLSRTIAPMYDDKFYQTSCNKTRWSVDDDTFYRLKFERREECSPDT